MTKSSLKKVVCSMAGAVALMTVLPSFAFAESLLSVGHLAEPLRPEIEASKSGSITLKTVSGYSVNISFMLPYKADKIIEAVKNGNSIIDISDCQSTDSLLSTRFVDNKTPAFCWASKTYSVSYNNCGLGESVEISNIEASTNKKIVPLVTETFQVSKLEKVCLDSTKPQP